MSLKLILGSMYSGKTTQLIREIRRCKCINKPYILISHSSDNRYGSNVASTHDKVQEESNSCEKLSNIFIDMELYNQYMKSEYIFIEEGQFFPDIVEFCNKAVDIDNKHVIVSALDGDFNRKPFEVISNLIPLADNYCKLKALCKLCGDGTKAIYSKRIIQNNTEQILVGADGVYMAVCRKHYK